MVAVDLMTNSKDKKIRARMAGFLAGDGKAIAVSVTNDARQPMQQPGYRFVRPDPGELEHPPRTLEGLPEGK